MSYKLKIPKPTPVPRSPYVYKMRITTTWKLRTKNNHNPPPLRKLHTLRSLEVMDLRKKGIFVLRNPIIIYRIQNNLSFGRTCITSKSIQINSNQKSIKIHQLIIQDILEIDYIDLFRGLEA